jgi:hypothetical protein
VELFVCLFVWNISNIVDFDPLFLTFIRVFGRRSEENLFVRVFV